MKTQRFLLWIDRLSEWSGKLFSWLIVILTFVICVEVFKRYILNAPTAWIFDLTNMLYGTLFMMCGAYTLSQNGHVRGDFLYGSMRPRVQAALDLALYILFFIPGIAALMYAGIDFTAISWRIGEHSNVTAGGPPIYQFKAIIPIAGTLVMIQGLAEILRCIVCLRTGAWPERLNDVEEIDVIETQLAHSELVDEESRREAIGKAQTIHEEATRRGLGEARSIEEVAPRTATLSKDK
jgi:TRAP-type mannitol/chloroaromatic compound transport system permease small subunit